MENNLCYLRHLDGLCFQSTISGSLQTDMFFTQNFLILIKDSVSYWLFEFNAENFVAGSTIFVTDLELGWFAWQNHLKPAKDPVRKCGNLPVDCPILPFQGKLAEGHPQLPTILQSQHRGMEMVSASRRIVLWTAGIFL